MFVLMSLFSTDGDLFISFTYQLASLILGVSFQSIYRANCSEQVKRLLKIELQWHLSYVLNSRPKYRLPVGRLAIFAFNYDNDYCILFWSTEIKKCTGEYLAALKSSQQSSSSSQQYLPRCASDGSYAPTQCSYSIGYCWCVDVDTGKPIPGTTMKSSSLDCWKYSKLMLLGHLHFNWDIFIFVKWVVVSNFGCH